MNVPVTERNLALYPWYQAFSSALPWLPIFFLYFLEHLSFADSITLGAIYYFSVFLLEVPSGYLSDRFGRKHTLVAATVMFICAYVLFLAADTFASFVVAQVFIAAGIAFQSGSDSALLIDSLKVLGRESEYARREARAHRFAMTALALSCVAGGALGTVNLSLPYVASLLLSVVSFFLAISFHEPTKAGLRTVGTVTHQLRQIGLLLKDRRLLWIMMFYVIAYSLQHIPYEFVQPYIKLLVSDVWASIGSLQASPWIAGIIIGSSMFGGALAATISMQLYQKLGLVRLFLLGVLMQILIIAFLGLVLHPIILLVVVFRNFAMSLTHAPMLDALAPLVPDEQRATYLSAQSLFGRLSFAFVLWLLSQLSGGREELVWSELSLILDVSFYAGVALLIVLALAARMVRSDESIR